MLASRNAVPLTVIDVTFLADIGEGIASSQPAGLPAEWEDSCPIIFLIMTISDRTVPAQMARFRAAPTPNPFPLTRPTSHLLAA